MRGFIRQQLLQYVRRANPNTRIAILGLANRLILLQGFTSDPSVLRDVVERKLIARMPASLDQPDADHGHRTESLNPLLTGSIADDQGKSIEHPHSRECACV